MKYEDLKQELIQKFLDESPFIKLLEMTLVSLDTQAGMLTLKMPLTDKIERMAGSRQMHGGALASLIDTAGCFALVMDQMTAVPTINFRVDYLRPAIGGAVLADAVVRRTGRTVGVVDVDVTAENGALLALGRGVFGV
ncbi:MAG: PaaI family thioesterase [Pseudomonadota bacterium]